MSLRPRPSSVLAVLAFGLLVMTAFALSQAPKRSSYAGIPLPFPLERSVLAGSLTLVGHTVADIYKVEFPTGTISESLPPGKIFMVVTPNDNGVSNVPLDLALGAIQGNPLNYFGYLYWSQDAARETENADAPVFRDRFPGWFFASKKARDEDAQHGNTLADFEAAKNITFLRTDVAPGSLTLRKNALYILIVNEQDPVTLTIRNVCGDDVVNSAAEQCDEGYDNNKFDGICSALCTTIQPSPWPSPPSETVEDHRVENMIAPPAPGQFPVLSEDGSTAAYWNAGNLYFIDTRTEQVTAMPDIPGGFIIQSRIFGGGTDYLRLSADGRYATFVASNSQTSEYFVYDRQMQQFGNDVPPTGSFTGSYAIGDNHGDPLARVTGGDRYMIYRSMAPNGEFTLMVEDLQTRQSTSMFAGTPYEHNTNVGVRSITPDGRYASVVFKLNSQAPLQMVAMRARFDRQEKTFIGVLERNLGSYAMTKDVFVQIAYDGVSQSHYIRLARFEEPALP